MTQQDDNNISVPWVASPPRLDCGDDASQSAAVLLSKETAKLVLLDPEVLRDIPAHFQPSHIAPIIPKELGSSLDYRAKYDFSWDEKNLYVKVDVNDPDLDNNFPSFSEKQHLKSSSGGFLPDILYHSVALIVADTTPIQAGNNQTGRYTTEMRLFIRPPLAKKPLWTFFGRTADEEDFHPLGGTVVACPAGPTGFTLKFAAAWLSSGFWQPNAGTRAVLNLMAPRPLSPKLSMNQRAANAYTLQRSITITLRK